jgi:hypothetical protein
LQTLFVGESLAVAGKADDLFHPGGCGGPQVGRVDFHERVVVFEVVEGFFDAADFDAGGSFSNREADHGTGEAMFFQDRHVVGHDELDGGNADVLGGEAEVVERDGGVTPATDGVMDAGHFRDMKNRQKCLCHA